MTVRELQIASEMAKAHNFKIVLSHARETNTGYGIEFDYYRITGVNDINTEDNEIIFDVELIEKLNDE